MATPDHAGFRDAQRRLREHFGEAVTFLAPAVASYPPGTPTDPETGRPFDPTILPTGEPQATTVKCDVALRTAIEGAVDYGPLGAVEQAHIMLIADIDDRAKCEPADEFVCRGERYRVSAQKPDGIGGVQRWLIYGRRR